MPNPPVPRYKQPKFLFFILSIFIVCFMSYRQLPATPYSLAEIRNNAKVLNGTRFHKTELKELEIRDAHIKNMVFDDVQAPFSTVVNVTFENCRFTRINFMDSRFENVAFKNCVLENGGDPRILRNTTIFDGSVFKNVLFEKTALHSVVAYGLKGEHGYVYFRNITDYIPCGDEVALIQIRNSNVRIENSKLDKAGVNLYDRGETSLYLKNSQFKGDHLLSANKFVAENCTFNTGILGGGGFMLIQNSELARINLDPEGDIFLVHNTYPNFDGWEEWFSVKVYYSTECRGNANSTTHIIHSDPAPAYLHFNSGTIFVNNITLQNPEIFSNPRKYIKALHLRNVRILGGQIRSMSGFTEEKERIVTIPAGQWENVTIEPTVVVDEAKIENVKAYHLEFPKGIPWRENGPFSFEVTNVHEPFVWEGVKVPTPEEIGIEWWPKDPGYDPDYVADVLPPKES